MLFDTALAWSSLPDMLHGLLTTLALTVLVLFFGLALAIPLTLARMSPRRILSIPAAAYVVFFRGSPLLILLYLVYFGLAQIDMIRHGPLWIIFGSAFNCAVIGLTLNHTAYLTEILRGGLSAVPAGLNEASAALGISPRQTFTRIRLPLAMRYALKAYQNEVLMFTKGTAVVSVITVMDLTAAANEVFYRTYDPITPLITAAAFYWIVVNVMRIGFRQLDRYLNRHLLADEQRRTRLTTKRSAWARMGAKAAATGGIG
jgi:arginine/ornithine transport system permease protein